ncbi:TonB-dependent receptor [Novosphingobium profundi]|nr:TonB-dependent receptor [Novosphingobium profundi]
MGLALTAAMPNTACAQDGAGDAGPNEIIVTAQKRAQNVQDVPLSVQVIGARELEANAVQDFNDVSRLSPSLTIRPAENPASANVAIRGVGTLAFSPGVEPSVAIVLDDVALAFQSRAFTDMSDIERIEVLRGPQTTLYGKSASAGLINIVSKGPSDTFTAQVRAMATTDDEQQIGGFVSGPLTDTLGFRTSLNYDDFKGNTKNLADGKTLNGRRYFSSRNKLRWAPTSDLQVDLGVDYADGKTTSTRPFIAMGDGAILRGHPEYTQDVFAPGIAIGPGNTDVSIDFPTGNTYTDFAQSLRVSYDTGGPTLMSITAHDHYKSHDKFDSDDSAITSFQNFQYGHFDSEQFSQELRLISPGADRLRYTLGLYYSNVDIARDFYRGPLFASSSWDATNGSEQIAGFGQLEFDPVPGTTLIAGGRISREKIDYVFQDLNADALYAGRSSDTSGTYKLGVKQEITPDINLFATYATGHKGEAYDISSGFNQARADAGPVAPETSDSWELGLRTQLFDRALTFNVTAFNSTYRDFQTQAVENLADGTQNFRLTNVGKVRIRGVEMEALAHPLAGLTLNGSMTYLDAKFIEFEGAACYVGQTAAEGCVGTPARQDLTGKSMLLSPRWKMAGSFDYAVPLGDGPLELVSQGAVTWQSKTVPLDQNPRTVQGDYAMVNVALGLRSANRSWQVMAFVNNLFDQHYRYLINDVSNRYGTTAIQGYVPRDYARYGGVRLSYDF